MSKIIGNIPTDLTYFLRKPEKMFFRWDDIDDIEKAETGTFRSVYVSDATNKKTLESGKDWQKSYNKDIGDGTLSRPNDPFKVKIVNLEFRGHGGRAYKVITPDNLYFDLREDVLLDVIRNCDIIDGTPTCEFIWARVGSEMKLVRVGSILHNRLIESTKTLYTKDLKISELKPGDVCEGRTGSKHILIGKVEHTKVTTDNTVGRYTYGAGKTVVSLDHDTTYLWLSWPSDIPSFTKGMLFSEILNRPPSRLNWLFEFRKSCNFKTILGNIELPLNVIDVLRKKAIEALVEYQVNSKTPNIRYTSSQFYDKISIRVPGTGFPGDIEDKYRLKVGDSVNYH